jgi:hypothetical protein
MRPYRKLKQCPNRQSREAHAIRKAALAAKQLAKRVDGKGKLRRAQWLQSNERGTDV